MLKRLRRVLKYTGASLVGISFAEDFLLHNSDTAHFTWAACALILWFLHLTGPVIDD